MSSLNEFPNLTNSDILHLQKTRFVFSLSTYSYKLCYRVSIIETFEQLCLIYLCSYIFYLFKETVNNRHGKSEFGGGWVLMNY
jgi:hypothetical protein